MQIDPFDIQLCEIPAGSYSIGHDSVIYAQPEHIITLEAYAMAETAVTNALFAHFIDSGAYHEASFWTEMGWRWLKSKDDIQPAFWNDRNFNHSMQPIVGIGWYEALAFTVWLQTETGKNWRLPSEVEWETAVRHSDNAVIPQQQINSAERGIGRTVSAWGSGHVSWCGTHNMLGNVWEWTSTRWGHNWQSLDYRYPYDATDGREDLSGSHARVMRGGSWFDGLSQATPYSRGRFLPGSRASNIGFRLALSL